PSGAVHGHRHLRPGLDPQPSDGSGYLGLASLHGQHLHLLHHHRGHESGHLDGRLPGLRHAVRLCGHPDPGDAAGGGARPGPLHRPQPLQDQLRRV
ncbi:putative tumor suppressor protein MN1, partial [Ophiophagus hannah]